tara:strand:+ start:2351 stop:3955 length:1605 start_codon:yes stop_codon:yes gene_type:complete
MRLNELPAWKALHDDAARLRERRTDSLFAEDPGRLSWLALDAAGLHVDLSKNPLDRAALDKLLALATERRLAAGIAALFAGEHVNVTEDRPALHTLLRTPAGAPVDAALADRHADVLRVRQQIATLAGSIISGELRGFSGKPVRDVVNIGIGGSHLGPQVVCEALRARCNTNIGVHFVSNVDGGDIETVLARLDPATTLFIVASKSFTTAETLLNARTARTWLSQSAPDAKSIAPQFVAVTSQPARATEFGVAETNIFPMWDWVGGRYSLWSAIGLSIAIATGVDGFDGLLAGAHAMDEHFRTTSAATNIPVMLGLTAIWNNNFIGCDSLAIVPYDDRLQRLTEYLQQLEMESNGKRVSSDGTDVSVDTSPVLWGGVGTNVQHAFFQQLHQGTRRTAIDFLVALTNPVANRDHQDMLVANCFAQAEGLMSGRAGAAADGSDPLAAHRACPGNRPNTMIVCEALTPESLGALLAMYEHKTYTQAVIWGINPFDQWGVELGKGLADSILAEFRRGSAASHDPSTADLITRYLRTRG